jgi:glycosyltransferase involved in cell wall biosynthesis
VLKKIIFTVTNDLNHDQRMIRICTALAANYEVHLIGRLLPHSKPIVNQLFTQHRLKIRFQKGKLFYAEYNIRLFFFLLKNRFDMVCGIDLDTILPCYLVSKIKQKVCIYDAHEYFTEVPELLGRPFTKRVWEKIADFVLPKIKYCYTVGACLAELFEKRYGRTYAVIQNVPFQQKVQYQRIANEKIILYQGALNAGRGLEAAIEAMKYIENATLWLAGEGDLSQTLRQQVDNQQLTHKVKFLGFIAPKDLPQLTAQATIGLNLLDNKSLSYYYSLANKFFDYIQHGVPQITMRFPEYEKICLEHPVAELMDNLSVHEIVRTLQHLLKDENYYNQLKINALNAAQIFNWEKESKKLIQFYEQIVINSQ